MAEHPKCSFSATMRDLDSYRRSPADRRPTSLAPAQTQSQSSSRVRIKRAKVSASKPRLTSIRRPSANTTSKQQPPAPVPLCSIPATLTSTNRLSPRSGSSVDRSRVRTPHRRSRYIDGSEDAFAQQITMPDAAAIKVEPQNVALRVNPCRWGSGGIGKCLNVSGTNFSGIR